MTSYQLGSTRVDPFDARNLREIRCMTDPSVRKLLESAAQQAIAYRDRVETASPYATANADELRTAFDTGLPEDGRPGPEIIEDLAIAAQPGLLGVSGNAFYGWVMGGSHPVGVAADWLTSAWGQNAGIFQTSPAAAIAEEVAGKWLIDLLDLPRESSIGFTTGATMASFICLAAARQEVLRRVGWNITDDGVFGAPDIAVCISEEAHSSIFATLRFLGFGQNRLTQIAADEQGRMSAHDLASQIENDDRPKIIISQAGHINSGAFDDFEAISAIAASSGAWLHVDGAFGLWARSASDKKHLCAGADKADSWAVDGHKWLQVPYDSGYAIVKDAAAHQSAMAITASYLNQSVDDGRNPSHYVPELSRRARGFATWAVLQALGRKGVEQIVLQTCANATRLANHLREAEGITLLNDVSLNQIALAFGDERGQIDGDELTRRVIRHLQNDGQWFIKDAIWQGRTIMRISFSSQGKDDAEIDRFAAAIVGALQTALGHA